MLNNNPNKIPGRITEVITYFLPKTGETDDPKIYANKMAVHQIYIDQVCPGEQYLFFSRCKPFSSGIELVLKTFIWMQRATTNE